MAINTKKVTGRREVRFESLAELQADVERLRDAAGGGDGQGSVQSLGNWSLGQATQHLARFMTSSIEGFHGAPFFLRPMGMMMQLFMGRKLLDNPPPAGIRLPEKTPFFPDAEVSVEAGVAELLAVLDRVDKGDKFVQKSPLLGKLSHEQWTTLHCRHAELHLSFFKA
jgi:Protein of unknown function (DUF1569)